MEDVRDVNYDKVLGKRLLEVTAGEGYVKLLFEEYKELRFYTAGDGKIDGVIIHIDKKRDNEKEGVCFDCVRDDGTCEIKKGSKYPMGQCYRHVKVEDTYPYNLWKERAIDMKCDDCGKEFGKKELVKKGLKWLCKICIANIDKKVSLL